MTPLLSTIMALAIAGVAALFTAAVGAPLAARLSQAHSWRRAAPADAFTERTQMTPRNFVPIDFGPDDMLWPSENPRQRASLPVPPWPSENWDDPDFGRGDAARQSADALQAAAAADAQREEQQRREATARREAEVAQRQQQQQRAHDQRHALPEHQVSQQQQHQQQDVARQQQARRAQQLQQQQAERAKRMAEQQQRVAAEQARVAAEQARREQARLAAQRAAQPSAARPQPQDFADDVAGLPTRAQLEALVDQHGLAGTVQYLMRDQGWDFKTAAAWLAKTRKG